MTTWGIVSTVRAPMAEVLAFAAWHLEMGAHRLYLYLDAPDENLLEKLKTHPRIRPVVTDDAYWDQRGRRPKKHQVRQVRNATRTYRRRADVDWLAHIDVDEFLIPEAPIDTLLSSLTEGTQVARMRPMEALAQPAEPQTYWNFKTLTLDRQTRRSQSERVWPTYGPYLNGGFLSHVAGKIFVRAGLPDADFKIHNVYSDGQENPNSVEFDQVALAHMHAKSWPDWLAHYRFRHQQGSYRAELKPDRPRDKGGLSLHELFAMIEAEGGESALRLFFDEVCASTPGHLDRLAAEGLLRRVELPLEEVREKHFGDSPAAT
ncbi:glycosyltransferase family 2 protein [Pseudooceanicola sp. MF1-13]|uniref:glycosyltransferase family 2 protein n=1 Tax=Pseudooceanicola sp. MF1-13 TaxID=3379095 RepID=UPI00389166A8